MAWCTAAALAARHYGVPLREVLDIRGRDSRVVGERLKARRMALYLANVGANMPKRALRRATGLRISTLRHHIDALGDARDAEPALDDLLEMIAAKMAPLALWAAAELARAKGDPAVVSLGAVA